MNDTVKDNTFTIVVGGAAGVGTRELGSTISQTVAKKGYEVFTSVDYPSLIRGGHNFSRITFSRDTVFNDHSVIDILIAFDEQTVTLHKNELADNALVLADDFSDEMKEFLGDRAIFVPMNALMKEFAAPPITKGSVMLGAMCCLLDIPFDLVSGVLADVFKDKKSDINIALAEKGYDEIAQRGIKHSKKIEDAEGEKSLLNGSITFGQGLAKAALDFYVVYPMTPASPILHFLAKAQKELNIKVVQPENELSVINMALGMAYAGKRVAIGTAGGGFALMQESFSFAGIAELPLVIAMAQRQAPASGVPTYTSQADLLFTVHAGHGEFPRIVIAPGDAEESFYSGVDSLNLAWKYQLPVIVIFDKHLTESVMTGTINMEKNINVEYGMRAVETGESYKRYQLKEDGISPLAFPGTPDTVVKVTSYEHDAAGITTEEPQDVIAMQDKRFAKIKTIEKEFEKYSTIKVYGDKDSKKVVIFWGSTKGAVLEAAKYLEYPVKFLQILWVEPFDTEAVMAQLQGAEKIVDVEGNHDGQMASIIRQKTGIEITDKVLRYDSRPFDPRELADALDKILK